MRRAYDEAPRLRARARRLRRPDRPLPARAREPRGDEERRRQAALASTLHLTELVARIDDGCGERRGRRLAPDPREREQVRHLARRDRDRAGAGSRRSAATARSRTSRRCRASTATRSSSRAGRARTTSSARRRSATSAKLEAVDLVRRARSESPAELGPRLRRSIAEPEFGALHFRRQLDTLVRALQVSCLRAEGNEPAAELARPPPPRRRATTPRPTPEYAGADRARPRRLRAQVTLCY